MLKRILWILPLLALTVTLFGQDQQESTGGGENRSNRGRGNRGNGGGPGGGGPGGGGSGFEAIREAMAKADAQIKEKLPEEYKELEKLDAAGDRRAAMQKRQELAQKAGIEMPSFGGGRGGRNGDQRRPDAANEQKNALEEWTKAENAIKEKFPDEYAEIAKLRETDMAAALVKLRELAEKAEVKLPEGEPPGKAVAPRNVARLAVERANSILQRRYPEEYAEIVKLRDEDPELAREKFRELFQKAGLNAEDLKKQVVARAASTRVIQVEVPQQNNNNNNNNRRQGGWGGPPGWGG